MGSKTFRIAYKLFFSLLVFSALVTEIATAAERGLFNAANFFSYFTTESNILVFATLLLSAVALAAGKNDRLSVLRGIAVVYILVVGLGFTLLLSGLEGVEFTAVPWDNTVLHYIMPLAVLVDYLIDRPGRRLRFRNSLWWLSFAVTYVGYSLLRGLFTDWYPYPFLNPAYKGYGFIALIVVMLLLLGTLLIWLATRWSGRQRT